MHSHLRQLQTRGRRRPSAHENRDASRATAAPRYKLALLTWAAAYAVITLMLAVVGLAIASWPLLVRTLILSATMVVSLTWLIMPRLTRLFGGWLYARV